MTCECVVICPSSSSSSFDRPSSTWWTLLAICSSGGVDLTNSGVWYHCLYLAATWHKMFHTVSHKCYELAHAAHCHYLLHSLSRCVTSRILEKMSLVGSSLLSIIYVKAQHCSWSIIIWGAQGVKKKNAFRPVSSPTAGPALKRRHQGLGLLPFPGPGNL